MIDLEKNIICENIKEFVFIKKLLSDSGLKDGQTDLNFLCPDEKITFPIYFYQHDYDEYYCWYEYDQYCYKECIKAKQIMREIKLKNII